MCLSTDHLKMTRGCINLARMCAIGSESRRSWLESARTHYTQYRNALRLERR